MHPGAVRAHHAVGRGAGRRRGRRGASEPLAGHRGRRCRQPRRQLHRLGGRLVRRRAWRRWSRFLPGSEDGLERSRRWFDRYGGRAVFFGRLLPVVRTFISLPAGFARMRPLRFGVYTVAGCVPWIAGLAWAGWAAGANWHRVTGLVQNAGDVVGAIVVVLLIVAVVFFVRARKRRAGASRSTATGDSRSTATADSRRDSETGRLQFVPAGRSLRGARGSEQSSGGAGTGRSASGSERAS